MKKKLTKEVIVYIRKNKRVVLKIALALDCDIETVRNYLRENNAILTTPPVLNVLRRETALMKIVLIRKF
ncbi:MAG TPA: hypothetical protein VK622_14395 [Puia sp.]|nr:hypothetical protein [Puia sp.]